MSELWGNGKCFTLESVKHNRDDAHNDRHTNLCWNLRARAERDPAMQRRVCIHYLQQLLTASLSLCRDRSRSDPPQHLNPLAPIQANKCMLQSAHGTKSSLTLSLTKPVSKQPNHPVARPANCPVRSTKDTRPNVTPKSARTREPGKHGGNSQNRTFLSAINISTEKLWRAPGRSLSRRRWRAVTITRERQLDLR